MEVKSFVNYILGSLVLFASLIALTPLIGINSVIVSFFLSMTMITLLNLRMIKKQVPNFSFNLLSLSKYTLIVIAASLIGHFTSNILLHVMNNFLSAVVGGGLAIVITLILCKVFNLYDLTQLLTLIKKKKKKTQ